MTERNILFSKDLSNYFHVNCRAASLYVSMNEGLSFISSSVTITTVSCVSIILNYLSLFFCVFLCLTTNVGTAALVLKGL